MTDAFCFDVDAFARDEFVAAAFLEECRTRNPMDTIHKDLKAFQTTLENQLVAIINADYTEFLQLSSKLKGVDEAVASVRSPLQAILRRVDDVDAVIRALKAKVHDQSQRRDELCQAEADVQLSIRISEKLLLLEELLEISSPEETDHSATNDDSDDDDGFDNFDAIHRARSMGSAAEGCARLERATQILLQLDLEFLEGVDIPMVQREEKRLTTTEEALVRRLETELATEILPDTFYHRDRAIDAVALAYLLRSYVLLQKTSVPEDMIARLLVQPFAEEHITRGKLDGGVRGSCGGLSHIYDGIIEFISSKFAGILALQVCQGDRKCAVDILGNGIWKPLCDILISKHSTIFTTADADRFHSNYITSMHFLQKMESFCRTEDMKKRFRTHESVVQFKEKWNMDVYFQLRHNQIAASVTAAFREGARTDAIPDLTRGPRFLFGSTRALWHGMLSCWDDKVFISPLLPEFTRLCLQLLQHYMEVWRNPILEAVAQVKATSKANFSNTLLACLSTEEDILCAGNDFHVLHVKMVDELMPVMKKHASAFLDNPDEFVEDLYRESKGKLGQLEADCWSAGASLVADECKKVLPALRTVKGQYQMTNKPPPTKASTYVANIIRPLEVFLDRWGVHFVSGRKESIVQSVLDPVCEMYFTLSSELLKSAQELEESLKSRKMQRNTGAGATSSMEGMSDTEKMRLQLRLDLEQMKRLVKKLGFELETCPSFDDLARSLTVD